MRSAVIEKPGQIRVKELATPEPQNNEVLIKVKASGICGTDLHIFEGDYIGTYPVIPGHEFSGIVEKIGKDITRFQVGDRVAVEPNIACDNCYYCLNNQHNFCANWQAVGVTLPGGMAQYVLVPEKALFDIGELPFNEAAFVEPLSCVIHALEQTHLKQGESVAIVGAGPIGMLLLQCCRHLGATEITVVDINRERADFAKEFSADYIYYSIDELKIDYYDLVIDATGVASVMERLLDFVAFGKRVLLFGVSTQEAKIEISPFELFRKGATILSSYTSSRNSYQAIKLLQSKAVKVNLLISHQLPLEHLEKGIQMIKEGASSVKKVMIIPNN